MKDRIREHANVWAWVGGAAIVIIVILILWAWGGAQNPQYAGYAATSTPDALESPNNPTRTVAEEARDGTVLGIIAGIPEASRFGTLLSSTGVKAEIAGQGPYTVFVPTNASFSLLPPGALNLSGTQMRRLAEYHVVMGRAIDVNAQLAGTIQALSKDMLNFSVFPSDKSARVNSAVALKAYKASNGIVYLVSEVLLPPVGATLR